jgi:hypothetical protein
VEEVRDGARSAGSLTPLLVLSACDSYCEGVEAKGMMLHIGVGTLAGTGIGVLVHQLRYR